jgi:hypothetical protein
MGPLGASCRKIALGSNREGAAPYVKPRAMHERTYQRILGMLAYHEAVRRGRVTLENTGPINIGLICGGNAKTGLRNWPDGRFAETPRRRRSVGDDSTHKKDTPGSDASSRL